MNAKRRIAINDIVARIREQLLILETLRDEEQDYYDNMPEGLQQSDRGSTAEAAIDIMTDAVSGLEDVANNLENVE